MSNIFKMLILMVSLIVLMSGCKIEQGNDIEQTPAHNTPGGKEDINLKPKPQNTKTPEQTPTPEKTPTPEQTPTPEPSSHNEEVNQFKDIDVYLGEWLSENHTETILDDEGGVIESTDDDLKGRIGIRLNEQDEPKVYISFIKAEKYFESTFKVAFDEKGTAIINNVNEEIKSIKLILGHDPYTISADFEFENETIYMGFVRLEHLSIIDKL